MSWAKRTGQRREEILKGKSSIHCGEKESKNYKVDGAKGLLFQTTR